jgi:hypothetical protein
MGTLEESFTGRISFYGCFYGFVLQFYGHDSILRISRGSFTGMEYGLFFCVF